MKKTILAVSAALLAFSASPAAAQNFTKSNRSYAVGAAISASSYFGDLMPGASHLATNPGLTQPSLGLNVTRKLLPNISVRASLSWIRLKGEDNAGTKQGAGIDIGGREARNLSFRNDVKELAVVGMYDLYALHSEFSKRRKVNPYLFAGIALFHHNPKAYYEGNRMNKGWYDLQPLHTEGKENAYSRVQLSIPLGFGLRYRLDRNWDLGFEIGWRKTFTDYLDDVSKSYVDKGTLNQESGEAAWILSDRSVELAQQPLTYTGTDGQSYPYTPGYGTDGIRRGNSNNKDWYMLTGLNISYYLSEKGSIPKFR